MERGKGQGRTGQGVGGGGATEHRSIGRWIEEGGQVDGRRSEGVEEGGGLAAELIDRYKIIRVN